MGDLHTRKGCVKISGYYIHNKPEVVMDILKEMLIIDATYDFMEDTFIYRGYSYLFDKEENTTKSIPEYTPLVQDGKFKEFNYGYQI